MILMLEVANTESVLARAMKVRNKVFTIEKGIPKSIEVDVNDCLNLEYDHFVTVSDGQDVCALRCKWLKEDCVQVQRFCVLWDFRKSGVGRWTLTEVEQYYRKKGVRKLTLDSKFEASGFYENCGYTIVSEMFMEAGVGHVKMEKIL